MTSSSSESFGGPSKWFPFTHFQENKLKRRVTIFAALFNVLAVAYVVSLLVGVVVEGDDDRNVLADEVMGVESNIVSWSEKFTRKLKSGQTDLGERAPFTLAMTWHASSFCFQEVNPNPEGDQISGCLYTSRPAKPFDLPFFLHETERVLAKELPEQEIERADALGLDDIVASRKIGAVVAPVILQAMAVVTILGSVIGTLIVRRVNVIAKNKVARNLPLFGQYLALLLLFIAAAVFEWVATTAFNYLVRYRGDNFPSKSKTFSSLLWSSVVAQLFAVLSWHARERLHRRLGKVQLYPLSSPAPPQSAHGQQMPTPYGPRANMPPRPPIEGTATVSTALPTRAPTTVYASTSREPLVTASNQGSQAHSSDDTPPPYSTHDPYASQTANLHAASASTLPLRDSIELSDLDPVTGLPYGRYDASEEVNDGIVANGTARGNQQPRS